MAVTTYIVDKDGNQIDASTATVPSDRNFRGAWSLSGHQHLRYQLNLQILLHGSLPTPYA